MGQSEAVRDWWADADEVTRRRALALAEDDFLPEDMQRDLAMAGVRVIPHCHRGGTCHPGSDHPPG